MLKTHIGRLRITGIIEGISFLLLLFIAMPLKYFADMPEMVTWVGAAHGALFVLYILTILIVWIAHRWSFVRVLLAVISSVVPFGPFIFDWWLRKQIEREELSAAENIG